VDGKREIIKRAREREVILIARCAVCGQDLGIEAVFDGIKIKRSAPIRWEYDGKDGFLCDKHRRAPWLNLQPDPRDRTRRPAEKERAILDALEKFPGGLTAIELESITKYERTAIYKRLVAMQKRDQVQKKKNKFFMK